MKLVADANIIIAALIARSATLRLILDDRLALITSGFAFDEINSHMKEIMGKAQLNEGEMHEVMARIRDRIAVERP
jgi:predicted nucleic acid-binding protein